MPMNLLQLQSDPVAFRQALLIDTDFGATRFADVIEEWQDSDFRALDDGWKRAVIGTTHTANHQRAWLERPRGHSKSLDIGVMAAWALFSSRRQIAGYAGAGDLDQARILRDAIGRLLYVNPWLADILEVQNYRVINHHTKSTLEIISSDAPTSYGLLPDFVVCDEVCHWKKRDLFDSLLSSAAKRSTCMLVCISNAGLMDDWAWQLREAVRKDPAWHFSRLDGPVASWITSDRLEEQRRLLPNIAFRRLWLNEWTTGGGDALTPEDINAAFIPNLKPQRCAQSGYEYVGGLDLGVTRDASAVVILGVKRSYEGHGRIRLAYSRIWRPKIGKKPSERAKVNLQEIEDTLIDLHVRFKLKTLNADPWNATHMVQRLQAAGLGVQDRYLGRMESTRLVPIVEVPQTGGTLQAMASTLIEAFNDRRVELFEDADLRRDLLRFRIEERSYGFRLTSPQDEYGHGDMGTAFSLAMLAASELAGKPIYRVGTLESVSQGSHFDLRRLERELNAEEERLAAMPDDDIDPDSIRVGWSNLTSF